MIELNGTKAGGNAKYEENKKRSRMARRLDTESTLMKARRKYDYKESI